VKYTFPRRDANRDGGLATSDWSEQWCLLSVVRAGGRLVYDTYLVA